MKRIGSVLNVETDHVDNAVGTGNGCLRGTFVMCVRSEMFDSILPAQPAMPRDHPHPGAGHAQMVHNTTANKTGPAKHGCAPHSAIRRMILWGAPDRSVKRGTHCFSGFCRGAAPLDMMRNYIDQDLRCRANHLPLLLCLIDQRFGFDVEVSRLFDDRS